MDGEDIGKCCARVATGTIGNCTEIVVRFVGKGRVVAVGTGGVSENMQGADVRD